MASMSKMMMDGSRGRISTTGILSWINHMITECDAFA